MSGIAAGTVIGGKFRIDALIGKGGMGEVYAATHTILGRQVAVKVLPGDFTNEFPRVRRFFREAKIAASLVHDHICEVTDVGETEGGVPFLVMPLLKGKPLSDLLTEEKRLEPSRAVGIVDQVLSALDATHRAGIVHRDLKPENIFLTSVGGLEDFVKLLDFGISKVASKDVRDTTLTDAGAVLGTPHYMSPEQIKNADVDHRTDLWAVGVILYRALTGRVPFDGASYGEIVAQILTAPFEFPDTSVPDIPKELSHAVIKALSRTPSDRFASADEMRRALRCAVPDRASLSPLSREDRSFGGETGNESTSAGAKREELGWSVTKRERPALSEERRDIASESRGGSRPFSHKKLLYIGIGFALSATALMVVLFARPTSFGAPKVDVPSTPRTLSDSDSKDLSFGAGVETSAKTDAKTDAAVDPASSEEADTSKSPKSSRERRAPDSSKQRRWIQGSPPGVVLDGEYR